MNMRLSLKKKEMKQTDEDCLMFKIVNLFVIKTIFAVEGGLQGEVLVRRALANARMVLARKGARSRDRLGRGSRMISYLQ